MGTNNDDADDTEVTNVIRGDTVKVQIDPHYKIPPCLVLLVGPDNQLGRQWPLSKPKLSLGRNLESDIHVSDDSLSKMHAQLIRMGDEIMISDLGATNGTLVNERQLIPHVPQALKNNDQIKTGRLVFKFLERGILTETAEKGRMQSELEMARAIQNSLLPSKPDAQYHWVRLGGRYQSATECGGDWWWHWTCADKVFVFIADATGHGVAAALLTSAARSAVATLESDTQVGIEKLYSTLSHAIRQCSGGLLAMSAFLVEIDLRTRRIKFVNASHVPAVFLTRERNLPWKDLTFLTDPISPHLGSNMESCFVGETTASHSTRLVLLTDGLTERIGSDGSALEERRFYQMLVSTHEAHMDSQTGFLNKLLQSSDDLAGHQSPDDDITVVVMDFV